MKEWGGGQLDRHTGRTIRGERTLAGDLNRIRQWCVGGEGGTRTVER